MKNPPAHYPGVVIISPLPSGTLTSDIGSRKRKRGTGSEGEYAIERAKSAVSPRCSCPFLSSSHTLSNHLLPSSRSLPNKLVPYSHPQKPSPPSSKKPSSKHPTFSSRSPSRNNHLLRRMSYSSSNSSTADHIPAADHKPATSDWGEGTWRSVGIQV